MYPQKLEFEKETVYYLESNCFTDAPMHLVHAYPHLNYKLKMHAHQFYEINIIVNGEGRHYVGDTSLPACVGDVFILPPEVPHGYFSTGKLDITHVLLRADFMARYREELTGFPGFSLLFDIEPQLRRSSGRSCNLRISPRELAGVSEEITRAMRAEQEGQFTYANVLTLGLIGRLCERLRQKMQKNVLTAHGGELLGVMEYIKENMEQKLTLQALAAKANMSVATLNRHFRDALHLSPMQYVMQCRLARARELLAKGAQSKTEIAQLCGFFDVSHMNKYL